MTSPLLVYPSLDRLAKAHLRKLRTLARKRAANAIDATHHRPDGGHRPPASGPGRSPGRPDGCSATTSSARANIARRPRPSADQHERHHP